MFIRLTQTRNQHGQSTLERTDIPSTRLHAVATELGGASPLGHRPVFGTADSTGRRNTSMMEVFVDGGTQTEARR